MLMVSTICRDTRRIFKCDEYNSDHIINNSKTFVSTKTIIIEGITEDGEKFRPSDWAERMSGSLCTFRNRRITYSPLLQPSVKNGNQCMLLDPELKDSNPSLYESIMDFVEQNHLRISEEVNKDAPLETNTPLDKS